MQITEKVLPKDGLLLTNSGKNSRREQKTFSASKLHKKMKLKSFLWILLTECSKTVFTPSFGNTLLYAVLFMQFVCRYAVEVREIYSFFCVGKKREGKCSFCFFRRESIGQKTKCAFTFAVGFLICFIDHNGRI